MRIFNDEDLEKIMQEVSEFSIPENPVIRAKNVVMAVVMKSVSGRLNNYQRSTKSFKFLQSLILKPKYMGIIALIVAIMVGGGGTVAAAQNDLPGEKLYGVKLAYERVAEKFTFDDEAQLAIAARFADRRAREITELRARAQVRAEAQGDAETQNDDTKQVAEFIARTSAKLAARIEKMNNQIAHLKEVSSEGTLRVAAELEGRVNVWEDVLATVGTASTRAEVKTALIDAHAHVRVLKDDVIDAQAQALKRHAADKGFEASARHRVAAAEEKLVEVTRFREKFLARAQEKGRELGAAFEEVDAHFHAAIELVSAANAALEASDWEGSWVKANEAFKEMIQFQGMLHVRATIHAPRADMNADAQAEAEVEEESDSDDNDDADDKDKSDTHAAVKTQARLRALIEERFEVPSSLEEQSNARVRAETALRAANEFVVTHQARLGAVLRAHVETLLIRARIAFSENRFEDTVRVSQRVLAEVKAFLDVKAENKVDGETGANMSGEASGETSENDDTTEVNGAVKLDVEVDGF